MGGVFEPAAFLSYRGWNPSPGSRKEKRGGGGGEGGGRALEKSTGWCGGGNVFAPSSPHSPRIHGGWRGIDSVVTAAARPRVALRQAVVVVRVFLEAAGTPIRG